MREPRQVPAFAIATVACLLAYGVVLVIRAEPHDFAAFYLSAKCILNGCDRYAWSATGPNLNPPFTHWLFLPFVGLTLERAAAVWMVLSLASLAAAAWLTGRTLRLVWTPWTATALALLSVSAPARYSLEAGQVSAVLLVPLVWLWTLDRKSTADGSFVWGTLVWWKPPIGLVMLGRRLGARTLLRLAVAAALVLAFDIAVEGVGIYRAWLGALNAAQFPGNLLDGSLWQVIERACVPSSLGAVPCGMPKGLIGVLLAGPVVAISLFRMRKVSVDAAWLVGVSGGLLASPKGWIYYGPWLMPFGFAVWLSGSLYQRVLLLGALAITLLSPLSALAGQPSPLATFTAGSMYAWAYLLCWLAGLFERQRIRVIPTEPAAAALTPQLSDARRQ